MHGIKKLTIVSRSVISATGSKMDVSGPTLKQTSKRLGDDGENGKHGSPGAQGRTKLSYLSRFTLIKKNPTWVIDE